MAFQLYHGSDARIGYMTDEERTAFRKEIICALDYMWSLMEPYFQKFDEKVDRIHNRIKRTERIYQFKGKIDDFLWTKMYQALSHDKARRDGLSTWQYQDDVVYLTSDFRTAISYAYRSFVFGELGETIWDMYQGIKALNLDTWNPSAEVQATLDRVQHLGEEEHFPIVYVLSSLDYDKLLTDSGEIIPREKLETTHLFRYSDEFLCLTPNDLEHTIYLRPMDQVLQYRQKQIALYRQKIISRTT